MKGKIFVGAAFIGLLIVGVCEENKEIKNPSSFEEYKTQQMEVDVLEKEYEDMINNFINCKYGLISVEQTTITDTIKHFGGSYLEIDGEVSHYIVTLQYNGSREDWIDTWVGNKDNRATHHETTWSYMYEDQYEETGDYATMWESKLGMHSLVDFSGKPNKPSMEIRVVDVNGELIYRAFNGDWKMFNEDIKEWTSDEQKYILSHSDFVDTRWFRDCEEFLGLK